MIFDSFNFHQTNNIRYSITPKINICFNTDLNFISKYIYDDGCSLVVGSSLSLYNNSIATIQGTLMQATVQCECIAALVDLSWGWYRFLLVAAPSPVILDIWVLSKLSCIKVTRPNVYRCNRGSVAKWTLKDCINDSKDSLVGLYKIQLL